MQNTNRHIEHCVHTLDLDRRGNAIVQRAWSLRRPNDVELTIACLIVHAAAKALMRFRQFCCAADGMDYIENLIFADPIRIHWQRQVGDAIRAHRTMTSPQDLTLEELAETLQPTGEDGTDRALWQANAPGDPAFVIRHCDVSGEDSALGPTSAVAALLISDGTTDDGLVAAGSASKVQVRLAYDRRIITPTDARRFLAAINYHLVMTDPS